MGFYPAQYSLLDWVSRLHVPNPFADNFHSIYLEFLITVEPDENYAMTLIWVFIPILTTPNAKHTESL